LASIKNKIMIKGNHEQLYLDMLRRGYPEWHDYHNGTADTFDRLFDSDWSKAKRSRITKFVKSITQMSVEIGDYIICHSTPKDYWECPYVQEPIPGKTIVFGHWHTSDGPNFAEGELKDGIFYGNGIIGIDNGVQIKGRKMVHKQNVFIIEA